MEQTLAEKMKEIDEKDERIKNLEMEVMEKINTNTELESKLIEINNELESGKKLYEETNRKLEKEKGEKDDMMMRNAQISQKIELTKQKLRKQELESNELNSKINELEEKLNDKEKVSLQSPPSLFSPFLFLVLRLFLFYNYESIH